MKLKFEKSYIKWGLTIFIVAVLIMIVFFMIYRNVGLAAGIAKVNSVLTPFVYGLVMAYLLCPLFNLCVRKFRTVKIFHSGHVDKSLKIAKGIATFVSLAVLIGIIVGVIALIIPNVISTIVNISQTLPAAVQNLSDYISGFFKGDFASGPIGKWVSDGAENFVDWAQNSLQPQYDSIMSGVKEVGLGIFNLFKNIFLGVVICAFFLNIKEIIAAQCKKLILAIFREDRADAFLKGSAFVNKTFGKFIIGKLIDSLIIGVICFVFMMIANWPYPVLISVIVGVTNIIPFFGPFIGAIPSALLVLMEDPLTALYFLIFIFILQQIDGNIIGPKILGGSVGLSTFWIMFAILVGGGLFGFLGMLLGVPCFAIIYALVCYLVNNRLDKKGLSIDLNDYKDLYKYEPREDNVVAKEENGDKK